MCRPFCYRFLLLCLSGLWTLSQVPTGLAAGGVVITEFLASNNHGLKDEDGQTSDWIELQNQGTDAVSLEGWTLTDDPALPAKYRLPATNLLRNDFLIVFASGKNRRIAGAPLHANFTLKASGGYLALVQSDGHTLATVFDPYPPQVPDITYGTRQNVSLTRFVSPDSSLLYRVPLDDSLDSQWSDPLADAQGWSSGTNGLGYQAFVPGFAVKWIKSTGTVPNLNAAESVLTNAAVQAIQYAENRLVLNYLGTGNSGRYRQDFPFPGSVSTNVNVDDFVVEATGILTIPSPGAWTFGVHSDAGFRLSVGPFTAFAERSTANETLAVFQFSEAGDYPVRLMMFDRLGGSELEFYAARDSQATWSSTVFNLVGDVSNGGLAVRSIQTSNNQVVSLASRLHTDLREELFEKHTSVYLRIPFEVSSALSRTDLSLSVQALDGFAVFLNGEKVVTQNLGPVLSWDSKANAVREITQGLVPERLNLSPWLSRLKEGKNVLAVQVATASIHSLAMFFSADLAEYQYQNSTNQYFAKPTPGALNDTPGYAFVQEVHFSHGRGFYKTNFNLSLSCDTPGAVIRYTLNGTAPSSTNGTVYTKPILVDHTTTVRAAALLEGFVPSDSKTHTYLFLEDIVHQSPNHEVPPGWPSTWGGNTVDYGMDPKVVNHPLYRNTIQEDLKTIPSFSIVMNLDDLFNGSRGIYANPGQDGRDWEKPMSLELIYPDGRKGFQINGGIRIRGGFSRSTDNPKHAFRFFFREEYGASRLDYPVFGPTAVQSFDNFDLRTFQNYSWAFQGDARGCFIRDVSSRDTQLAMGEPSTHGDYYHLYINGQYWGLYNTEERPEASFGESYLGGKKEDYDVVKVEAGPYTINPTDGTMLAWSNLWKQAETSAGSDVVYQRLQGKNPDGSRNLDYPVLLDVTNLIDYMLVIEYGGNLDAPISAFLSNNSPNNWYGLRNRVGERGFSFVVHDSEHTLLNAFEDRTGIHLQGTKYVIDFSAGGTLDTSNPQRIWMRLHSSPEFRLAVADRIQKHFFNGGVLTTDECTKRFTNRMAQIDRAVVGESARWGDAKRPGSAFTREDWLAACQTVLSDFISIRSDVVFNQLKDDGLFPDLLAPTAAPFGGLVKAGSGVVLENPNGQGTLFYTIDGTDPRLLGGAVSPAARAYEGPIPISSQTHILARVQNASAWSAVIDAEFFPDQDFSKLILSEIMYNPAPSGSFTSDDLEFLELKNAGGEALDLTGLAFTSGVEFTFLPGSSLAAGDFLVLGRNPAALQSKYPGLSVRGTYSGKLDNAGESLTLKHPLGAEIFSVTYGDRTPWPLTADGLGFSVVPRRVEGGIVSSLNSSDGSRWRSSHNLGGSPGAEDAEINIPAILVNEILTYGEGNELDQIELYNPTSASVDLGGWWLSDDSSTPKKYRIPNGTRISAGGFLVFTEKQFNAAASALVPFSFRREGDSIYLFSGDSTGEITGYSHGFTFDASDRGITFGRYLNSIGVEEFPAQSNRTLGQSNALPRVGPVVLSEIAYHPASGYDSYIEIANTTDQPVPLFHPENPNIPWRLSGLNFDFPAHFTLAPHGLALIVGMDPDTFRSKYRVPSSTSVLGPYAGTLQRDGERLELRKPADPVTNLTSYITVDAVHYSNRNPWPAAADGSGPSLQRLHLDQYGNDPMNWFVSGQSPGRENGTNREPQVSIVAPVAGSSYNAPASVLLKVSTQDPDGEVIRVEYFANGVPIGESSTPPFDFLWDNASTGDLVLTAKVTDDHFSSVLSAGVSIRVLPAPPGNGIGLKAEYFLGTALAPNRLRVLRIDPIVDNHWGSGAPAPGIPADGFSVRWSGEVLAQYSGDHTFYTLSDDGVRLWVNDEILIDNWTDHGDTENSGTVTMLAGKRYSIRMEMYENSGGATASLAWSAPNLAKQVIPQTQLFPVSGETDLPILLSVPASLTTAVGSNAVFSVFALGNGPLKYQWQRDGKDIPGAVNTNWVVTNAQPSDEGLYRVRVSDSTATDTSPEATLRVLLKPLVLSPLQPIFAVVGETVVFSIQSDGGSPMTYRWRKGSSLAPNASAFLNSPFYVITNVQSSHAGSYSVGLSNAVGVAASGSALLTILPDADQDGIADAWETAHRLSSQQAADASADPDQDGMSNLQEYWADTDPQDGQSVLKLQASLSALQQPVLSFNARSNKTYTIQFLSEPLGGTTPVWSTWTHVLAQPAHRDLTFTDTNAAPGARLYRLVTPLQGP